MEEKFLTLEQVNELLPSAFKIDTANRIERSIYRKIGNTPLPIINSKKYDTPSVPYWFSCVTDHFNQIGASHICLTCGMEGIILVPTEIMLEYNKHSGWKTKTQKGKSYHIRVKAKDSKLILHCTEEFGDIDVTEYFIPSK